MKRILIGVVILGIIGAAIYFFLHGYMENAPYKEQKEKQEILRKAVVKEDEDPFLREIDFTTLKATNPDIVGWLYVPGIGVDMPILKGRSDTYYLNHDFEGKENPLGSIFTWADGNELLSDGTLCLFAHNINTGEMFGKLFQYQKEEFLKENHNIWLYTPYRTKKICIKGWLISHKDDDIFQEKEEIERQKVLLVTCVGYTSTNRRLIIVGEITEEKIK